MQMGSAVLVEFTTDYILLEVLLGLEHLEALFLGCITLGPGEEEPFRVEPERFRWL